MQCEARGCKEKGVGYINKKFLCAKHIYIEKHGEPKIACGWMSEKLKKQMMKENKHKKKQV
jgi:hypothetical protein